MWKYNNWCNSPRMFLPPILGQPHPNSMVFPSYKNLSGCTFFTDEEAMPFDGFAAPSFLLLDSASSLPRSPVNVGLGLAAERMRFLLFDPSEDRTSQVFSSAGAPVHNQGDPLITKESGHPPVIQSNGIDASDRNGIEEMHEDTEEIDALLYSDSYADHDGEEEVASTGHSPVETMSSTEIAASFAAPTKKRKLSDQLDESLVHTVISAMPGHRDEDKESSCVGACPLEGNGEEGSSQSIHSHHSKRRKRERIRETVGVLRTIIPGGKGKDAASVLDEAIRYLQFLKLKVKGFGATI